MSALLRNVRKRVGRYLPAEILGTLCALAGAFIALRYSHSVAAAAITGSVSEAVGFYGYFTWHSGLLHYRAHSAHPRRRLVTTYHTARDIMIEFGPAELLDSLFVRPFCMYAGPSVVGNEAAGLLAGKLVADVVFYGFATVGHACKKRLLPGPVVLPAIETDAD